MISATFNIVVIPTTLRELPCTIIPQGRKRSARSLAKPDDRGMRYRKP